MDLDDAEALLADAQTVACLQAPLQEAKELREACLAAEIPVLLARGACCGSSGCGCAPKIALHARAEDVPRVARVAQNRWRHMALREGTIDERHTSVAVPEGGEPPCPACGTAAPLVGGACGDCGLQLE
ncbi:MAG TPA: hypothetical protein VHM31_18525 [Polyangia bacterium]|nr:hypothetical protein [Polyangia bacterium]